MNARSAPRGPGTRARLLRRVAALDLPTGDLAPREVTEAEIESLPAPAQRYLRFMGIRAGACDWAFTARFRGQFRMKRGQSWMRYDAWQYNCAAPVTRVTAMRIDAFGIVPMLGTDTYVAGKGRMRGAVLGLVTVADGEGHEFDLGELVTYLNDALLIAPSMLLTPSVRWLTIDQHCFDIELRDCEHTVRGRAYVDDDGRLRDFRTEDRWYAGVEPPVRTPWSTPIVGWTRPAVGRPLPVGAAAVWQLPDGDFAYVRGAFDRASLQRNITPEQLAHP